MVLASGAFDGIHSGHVAYLEAAKALCEPGEPLWVAVAPDSYILRTKDRRAHWIADARCAAVAALRVVDRAYVQDGDSVAGEIVSSGPRLFVKGADWEDRLPADVIAACTAGETVMVFVETPGVHTREALG